MISHNTPSLPEWLRSTRVDGYRNVYELLPSESKLFGTESLFGDWNSRILVLAKDFYPSTYVQQRLRTPDIAHRHNPKAPTNKRLIRYVGDLRESTDPTTCGILYGSALASLLRDDGKKSGKLPNLESAMDFGAKAVRFAVDHMPRLGFIVAMGQEAWLATQRIFGHGESWPYAQECIDPIHTGSYKLIATRHPSRGRHFDHEQRWDLIRSLLREKTFS